MASGTRSHGTAMTTMPAADAWSTVPADAPSPSSETTDVNDSGPRLLAITTERPARSAVRAIACPSRPAPMMPTRLRSAGSIRFLFRPHCWTSGSQSLSSWVHLGAVAEVEPDGLHDPKSRARGEHVGRRQDTGVLLDDGCRGRVADSVEVALHSGPRVLAVLHEVRRGIDRVDGRPDAGGDVGHVLLVQGHVVAGTEPAEVATDEVLPRIGECVGRGLDVAGDVFGEVGDVDRRPPG